LGDTSEAPTQHTSPEAALPELAALLRSEATVISDHVVDPEAPAALGGLVAAGPRATGAPGEYALLVEAIREGYLLHYGTPRLMLDLDSDLALLAGDYLYAIGLERLATLGDLEAVREFSDLISLSALIHADGAPGAGDVDGGSPPDEADRSLAAGLWLGACVAVGVGGGDGHEAAKRAVRKGDPAAAARLIGAAVEGAERGSVRPQFESACEAIGLAVRNLSELG
jgi:hypothetical protein